MARKGRKTRWRKLPIPIGTSQGGATGGQSQNEEPSSQAQVETVSRVTFNEDEYTKITTPRQDMLFKKGYLGRKKVTPEPSSYLQPESPHTMSESAESEQLLSPEEPVPVPTPCIYPSGFIDQNGLFYSNGYEVYDPYSGSVTVVVGGQPLVALPCQPLPLPQVDWFPPPPHCHKRNSTDSQIWGSSQSCESPTSPQEYVEPPQEALFFAQSPYIYPGYMFGAPVYNVNGMSVGGPPAGSVVAPPQTTSPVDQPKRRKKRRKRRRPGVGEEGSESSSEEQGGSVGSGGSSDAGQGSSCSKTTDSGVHTANSGADSPQPAPENSDSADSRPQQPQQEPTPEAASDAEEPSEASTCAEVLPAVTTSQVTPSEAVNDKQRVNSSSENLNDTSDRSYEDLPQVLANEDSKNAIEAGDISLETLVIEIDKDSTSVETESPIETEVQDSDSVVPDTNETVLDDKTNQADERSSICDITEGENEIKEEMWEENICSVKLQGHEDRWQCLGDSAESADSEEHWQTAKETNTPQEVEEDSAWRNAEKTPDPSPTLESLKITLDNEIRWDDFIESSLMPDPEDPWGSAEETCATVDSDERWQNEEPEVGVEAVEVERPITSAVAKWLESQGTHALTVPQEESEDEGIGEEPSAGSKNADGNPFPAQCPSGGTRVAKKRAWEARCEPAACVHRYYRLSAESPPRIKTALHPFPCGLVCCILQ